MVLDMQACGRMQIKLVGALFVSSTSDIVFKPSAAVITDHNQSAKDILTYRPVF